MNTGGDNLAMAAAAYIANTTNMNAPIYDGPTTKSDKQPSLERIAKKLREQAQYFRNSQNDPHNINFPVAVALEIVAQTIEQSK